MMDVVLWMTAYVLLGNILLIFERVRKKICS